MCKHLELSAEPNRVEDAERIFALHESVIMIDKIPDASHLATLCSRLQRENVIEGPGLLPNLHGDSYYASRDPAESDSANYRIREKNIPNRTRKAGDQHKAQGEAKRNPG